MRDHLPLLATRIAELVMEADGDDAGGGERDGVGPKKDGVGNERYVPGQPVMLMKGVWDEVWRETVEWQRAGFSLLLHARLGALMKTERKEVWRERVERQRAGSSLQLHAQLCHL